MIPTTAISVLLGLMVAASPAVKPASSAELNEELWLAAREGKLETVKKLLARGAEVNSRTHYGASALWLAASKGHLEVVRFLLEHGADPNNTDGIWGNTPMSWALATPNPDMLKALLAAGADPDSALLDAVQAGQVSAVKTILEQGHPQPRTLSVALRFVSLNRDEIIKALQAAAARPLPARSGAEVERLKPYVGTYESHNGTKFQVTLDRGYLSTRSAYGDAFLLEPAGGEIFRALGYKNVAITFERRGDNVVRLTRRVGTVELPFQRVESVPGADPLRPDAEDTAAVTTPRPWPSFRGPGAAGVADGQHPPTAWDVGKGTNVRWKTPIPGLAHSSPIVWGDRIFLTTAVSADPKSEFKPGLYGAGTSAKDVARHRWLVYCIDRHTGRILWERLACEGVPRQKRHIKSSHANSTPATDGRHLVVWFASEGLYCYDLDGRLLWKKDLGMIESGAFSDPDLQWGAASSPILYRDLAIIQCDRYKDSFLAAFRADDGAPVWRTVRDELPSWGTPTVIEGPSRLELVTNGTKFIRGYDPLSGKELWHLGPNSEVTVPTPFLGQGLIFVVSGYHPIQPIYAILPGGTGDLSPGSDGSSSYVAWSKRRGGPYMPTPVVYGPHLYVCSNNGLLTCYEARTGKELYRKRLGGSGGYSASPVVADGRLYFAGEEGEVRVVKAGPTFRLLAVNRMADPCMATPAISDGMIIVRTQHTLYGIGRPEPGQGGRVGRAVVYRPSAVA